MSVSTQKLRQNETPKRLSKRRLTDKLVALIFTGKTNMTENAKTLGIGRATIYRYWGQWVESEEAQQLDVEWWATFKQLKKKSPVKAFEGLTRLKVRKTPQKIEAKTEGKIEVIAPWLNKFTLQQTNTNRTKDKENSIVAKQDSES